MEEMKRRLEFAGHPFDKNLLLESGRQGQYNLDAPDELPAGGVDWHHCVIDGHDISGPIEQMVSREGA